MDPILVTQNGVLRTAQANALFARGVVRGHLKADRWQQPYRGVVVTHNGPLSDDQVTWSRLLACPPGTVLGGLTAAEQCGFTGFSVDQTYVVLRYGARAPKIDGLVPHWSSYLDEPDVHPDRKPPRTRLPRSLVDGASWAGHERRARVIILAGVQQKLLAPRHLRDALSRRGACRHRGLIVESCLDAFGGIQSLPERDFDEIVARRGLPTPTRQRKLKRKDGRYYLDVAWDAYDVACEIHGIPHLDVPNWDADNFRANEITIAGPRLLVFSSYAVRRQAEQVGDQTERLLVNAGWRPASSLT